MRERQFDAPIGAHRPRGTSLAECSALRVFLGFGGQFPEAVPASTRAAPRGLRRARRFGAGARLQPAGMTSPGGFRWSGERRPRGSTDSSPWTPKGRPQPATAPQIRCAHESARSLCTGHARDAHARRRARSPSSDERRCRPTSACRSQGASLHAFVSASRRQRRRSLTGVSLPAETFTKSVRRLPFDGYSSSMRCMPAGSSMRTGVLP